VSSILMFLGHFFCSKAASRSARGVVRLREDQLA